MYCKALLDDGSTRIFTVSAEMTVAAAALKFTSHGIGAVMVVGGCGQLVGIFTERDLARAVALHGVGAPAMPIELFMSSPVATCAPDDELEDVMRMMNRRRIRHVPVVQNGLPVAMISARDVISRMVGEPLPETAGYRGYTAAA